MIEDDDVTVVAPAPEAMTATAAPPVAEVFPRPARKRRPTLWPTKPEDWGTRDDQRVFRAVERLLQKVPPHARRRVRNYIMDAFSQTTIEERVLPNGGAAAAYPPGASAR